MFDGVKETLKVLIAGPIHVLVALILSAFIIVTTWQIAPLNLLLGAIPMIPALILAYKEDMRQILASLLRAKDGMETTEERRAEIIEELEKERAKRKPLPW